MREIKQTEEKKPATSPMNLDAGKLTPWEVLQIGGVAALCCLAGTFGALLFWLVTPLDGSYPGFRIIVGTFGGSVAVLGFSLAWVTRSLYVRSCKGYLDRLDDWHAATLAAYESSDGMEVKTETSIRDLRPTDPRDVLFVAIALSVKLAAGELDGVSVRSLKGDLWIGYTRLGDVVNPEGMYKALQQAGLLRVVGKKAHWVPTSLEETVKIHQRGITKVRNESVLLMPGEDRDE